MPLHLSCCSWRSLLRVHVDGPDLIQHCLAWHSLAYWERESFPLLLYVHKHKAVWPQ